MVIFAKAKEKLPVLHRLAIFKRLSFKVQMLNYLANITVLQTASQNVAQLMTKINTKS